MGSESREDTISVPGEPKRTGQQTRLSLNCPPAVDLSVEIGPSGQLTPKSLQSPIFKPSS